MKCADCKFWQALQNTDTDPFADGFGNCRRYAPRPNTHTLLAILDGLRSRGSVTDAASPVEFGAGFSARTTAWPATFEDDFCGEFVAAKSPSFV